MQDLLCSRAAFIAGAHSQIKAASGFCVTVPSIEAVAQAYGSRALTRETRDYHCMAVQSSS